MTAAKPAKLRRDRPVAQGKRRLTAKQFDALLPYLTNMSKKRVDAARLALVDDLTLSQIAKHYGWSSRQNVSDAINAVFAARQHFEETQPIALARRVMTPPGWRAVTLLAPAALITRWRRELAIEFAKTLAGRGKKTRPPKALGPG